jgi:hypothetical protein
VDRTLIESGRFQHSNSESVAIQNPSFGQPGALVLPGRIVQTGCGEIQFDELQKERLGEPGARGKRVGREIPQCPQGHAEASRNR